MEQQPQKKRNELRIPLPDLDAVADRVERWSEKVRWMEQNPPKWVRGLIAVLLVAAMVSFRHYGH